jgi:hypothetical protein
LRRRNGVWCAGNVSCPHIVCPCCQARARTRCGRGVFRWFTGPGPGGSERGGGGRRVHERRGGRPAVAEKSEPHRDDGRAVARIRFFARRLPCRAGSLRLVCVLGVPFVRGRVRGGSPCSFSMLSLSVSRNEERTFSKPGRGSSGGGSRAECRGRLPPAVRFPGELLCLSFPWRCMDARPGEGKKGSGARPKGDP